MGVAEKRRLAQKARKGPRRGPSREKACLNPKKTGGAVHRGETCKGFMKKGDRRSKRTYIKASSTKYAKDLKIESEKSSQGEETFLRRWGAVK